MSSSAAAAAAKKFQCATCEKSAGILTNGGSNRTFRTKYPDEHPQILGKQMDEVLLEHEQLRRRINEQTNDIDQWEQQSIDKIRQIANNARENLKRHLTERSQYLQTAVQQLKEKIDRARIKNDFVETDRKMWSDTINELKTDMSVSVPIFIKNIDDNLIRLDPHHPSRLIELTKTSQGLGFTIASSRDEDSPIYISRIIPNSVAWKHGGLKKGDQLLSINGISVENGCHEKAVDLIRQAQGSVKLVVRYSPQILTAMENRIEKQRVPVSLVNQ